MSAIVGKGDAGLATRPSATGLMLAAAVSVLALPSGVLAFSNRFEIALSPANPEIGGISGNDAPGKALATLNARSLAQGRPFPFTPAGTPNRPDRAVTVAVRVDPMVAREIIVLGIGAKPRRTALSTQLAAASRGGSDSAALQMAPSAFNLGVSRGYQGFAQPIVPASDIRKIEMPDLSAFSPGKQTAQSNPRLMPRIQLDERANVGRAPRTFAGDGEDRVDVGGSLRVTKNLDVTAGVRYSSQERDRLRPLTDGKQDNQAVYVGTQFRF